MRDARALLELIVSSYSSLQDGKYSPQLAAQVFDGLHKTLYSTYFRTEILHTERLPAKGPAMLYANHSGILPYDGINVAVGVHHETGRIVRGLVERAFAAPSMKQVYKVLQSMGSEVGSQQAASRLLHEKELVLVFPGGAPEIAKPSRQKYQVKDWKGFAKGSGGYLKAAVRNRVPLFPVAIVGAEETHYNVANLGWLARKLNLPAFPVPLNALPLPAKFYIDIGQPFEFHEEYKPKDMEDQRLVDFLNTECKSRLERMLYSLLRRREGIVRSTLR